MSKGFFPVALAPLVFFFTNYLGNPIWPPCRIDLFELNAFLS